jgi:DNA-binding MarR family transcriptional regulator/N-acetylglutamate synthase-like GNAT family acetyltransferase
MTLDSVEKLRYLSRKLLRELGILGIEDQTHLSPAHWHSLIEIDKEPGITISRLGNLLLISSSRISRLIKNLLQEELIEARQGVDKREKYLYITPSGRKAIENIDAFSRKKIVGAFTYLEKEEIDTLIDSVEKYTFALEKSRLLIDQVKIATLPTSRAIRKQIMSMIENIQKNEFSIPVSAEANDSVLKAEQHFYYNNAYNFWYAVDEKGTIIGSIGISKIDQETGQLKKFFVTKEYRGKGIALKLMDTAIRAARKHGLKHLYLGTVDVLKAAHQFYAKYGFKRIRKNELPENFELIPVDTHFFKLELG